MGVGQGRFGGSSWETVVLEYVGAKNNPELKRLLDEVFPSDTTIVTMPTQLAELMKVAYRSLGTESRMVCYNVSIAIKVIINQEQYHYGSVGDEKPLKILVNQFLAEDEQCKEMPKVRSRINQLAGNSSARGDRFVTELSYVMEAFYRFPYAFDTVIKPQFEFYMSCLKADTIEFQEVLAELEQAEPIEVRALLNDRDRTVNLLVCPSDKPQTNKAARSLGHQIILVRGSSGNFQINTDKKWFSERGLSLVNVVRMIRWYELSPEKRKSADWRSLGCSGNHSDVDNIHYPENLEAIYNGTFTHDARPSKISTQALVEAIKYGFHPYYVKKWCNERGIIMDPVKIAQIKADRRREKPQQAAVLPVEMNPVVAQNVQVKIEGETHLAPEAPAEVAVNA